MGYWLDYGIYTPGATPPKLRDIRINGQPIVGCIVGTQDHDGNSMSEGWIQQCRWVQEAGKKLEVYIYLYADIDRLQVDFVLDICRQEGLNPGRIWLDAEHGYELPGQEEGRRLEILAEYIKGKGFKTGIYTGGWWWVPNVGNYPGLGDEPLWTANYADPACTAPAYKPWTSVHTHQYAGTVQVDGLNLDLNCRKVEDPDEGEEEMTAEELITLVGSMDEDQQNRFYKGFKNVKLDLVNPLPDQPNPPLWNKNDHWVKTAIGDLRKECKAAIERVDELEAMMNELPGVSADQVIEELIDRLR